MGEFNQFDTTDMNVLDEPLQIITLFFKNVYQLEMRYGIWIMIFSIMCLGVSFLAFGSSVQSRAGSKMWLLRIVLVILMIFGMVGFISMLIELGMTGDS